MVQNVIEIILPIVAGVIGLYTAIKFMKDPKFAKNYIETSPKAWLWRKIFGVEKAIEITKKVFAPLGIILSIALIILGIYIFIA